MHSPFHAEAIDTLPTLERDTTNAVLDYLNKKRQFAIAPLAPAPVKATDRKGGVFVQFIRTRGADGYEVSVYSDAAASALLKRETWNGVGNTSGFISLGQIGQAVYVRVRSFIGDKFSNQAGSGPCGISNVTGTSNQIDAGTESPPTPVGAENQPQDTVITGGQIEHGLIL